MHLAFVVVLLFSVATCVAIIARRFDLPYTLALVVAGLALGQTRLVSPPALSQDLLYAVFLPGLLFEAAYHLKFEDLRCGATRVVALAVPGVVAGTVLTAALLAALASSDGAKIGFGTALVFGAVVAATDPVAVVAVFRDLGAPRALRVLVEGESLLNDGTAAVLFLVATALVGHGVSIGEAIVTFVRVVAIGVAVGGALGFVVSAVMKRVDDPMIEIALTTIAAYGSFTTAERVRGSGILATVTAAIVCGSWAAQHAMTQTSRAAVESFWEYVAFASNSIVFLLVGFVLDVRMLGHEWRAIAIAYAATTVARAAIVYGVSLILHRTRERVPWSWSAVLFWGGLRGALSMVLALSLPKDFPGRQAIVAMTFGVVVTSLLVQGATMQALLRRLGVCADR